MIFFVCSIRDSAIDAYMRPFYVPHTGAAVRDFTDEINRSAPDNPLSKHPDDFELYCLGQWSDVDCRFKEEGPTLLLRGKDCFKG